MAQQVEIASRGARSARAARRTRLWLPRLWLPLLAGCVIATPALAADKPDPLAGALSVSVKRAREMCFKDQVEVTGTLAARREAEVAAPREGFVVAQVAVGPLDQVAAGQVLAQLAPADNPSNLAAAIALKSPVAGIVGRSAAVVGMPASPRMGPLFRIIANGEMDLRAEAPIDDLKKLSVGQKVVVTPLGGAATPGKVQFIAPSVDPASQLGRVRIGLEDARSLPSGVFARGVVAVAERCGTGVPYSSIMYQPDGTIVHVVVDNRVIARRVEIGLLAGTDVEIRSGVTADDLVVTRSGPFLRDGDLVNAIKTGEPVAEVSSRGEAR